MYGLQPNLSDCSVILNNAFDSATREVCNFLFSSIKETIREKYSSGYILLDKTSEKNSIYYALDLIIDYYGVRNLYLNYDNIIEEVCNFLRKHSSDKFAVTFYDNYIKISWKQ